MKNRESFLFSIVLLLVNATGAAGALLTSLDMTFGTVLQPALFLCGMLFLCLLSAVLWSTRNKRKMAQRWALLIVVFLVCILLFWEKLKNGLGWALQGVIGRINARYGIHLIWNLTREADLTELGVESVMLQATWSVLAVMLPFVLLLGYAVVRQRVLALLLADAVWFAAACTMDDFPAYVWFVLCILGFAAVVIRGAFRDDERAGMQAVLIGAAALSVAMALVYRFAVPFMDSRYEAAQEARIELSIKINEEWIPWIKGMLARIGSGEGTDVTGKLTRKSGTAYTSDEIYRVTFSSAPKSTVYLRGFVGKDYEGDEWKAGRDSDLEKYYRREGWELPESGSALINLTYDAFRGRTPGKVLVEELAAPGSYTVYPYGAQLTGDYKIHWDGTVERKSGSFEFLYGAPEDYRSERGLADAAAENEARYRDYVYDTFCQYPAEELSELTEFLDSAGFRTDSVYDSLEDVLSYLKGNASYNLDVPNTPRGKDFVEYFLFESREGYCAHFASSAVLILRYLGVPARYATGYAASPRDFKRNSDGTYSAVILDKQAHAWAEVYLDGIGWVPVEMTPGAAPFPRDNTAEQLALAGQLTGESGSDKALPAWQDSSAAGKSAAGADSAEPAESVENDGSEQSGSPEDEESAETDPPGQKVPAEDEGFEQEGSSEQENSGGVGQEGSAGDGGSGQGVFIGNGGLGRGNSAGSDGVGQEGSAGDGGSGQGVFIGNGGLGRGNSAGSDGVGRGGSAGSDGLGQGGSGADEDAETAGGLKFLAGAVAVLKPVLQIAGLLLLLVIIWKLTWVLIRRRSCGRLERAESREKVFLLYRNMRRLLAASGCAERLNRPDENTAEFNVLLEKCGFGEKEPVPEELQAAKEFCEKLAKEVYAGLPSYRKPLFLGLDVYGFVR